MHEVGVSFDHFLIHFLIKMIQYPSTWLLAVHFKMTDKIPAMAMNSSGMPKYCLMDMSRMAYPLGFCLL